MTRRVLEILLGGEGTVGGTEKHVSQLVDGLHPSSYRVDVFTWDIPPFVEQLRERGVDVTAVTSTHILDLKLVRQLQAKIATNRYDIVHAHGHRAGLIGRLAAIRAGAPAVLWTCHLPDNKADSNALLAHAYSAVMRWLGRRTNRTIAVSEYVRQWLVDKGIPRATIEVIYNCIDMDEFSPRPPSDEVLRSLGPDPSHKRPVVGSVARLTRQKNLDCLIDAIPLVLESHPDAQFVLVGGGPLQENLQFQASELQVAEHVHFAGERTDVPDVMATFDVAVLPSRSEGLGYVVLEAMASERPIVCSDIPPFQELVSDGRTGLIFPQGSARDLADRIVRLLDDTGLARQLAANGRRHVEEEFSLPVMLRRTQDMYEWALQATADKRGWPSASPEDGTSR